MRRLRFQRRALPIWLLISAVALILFYHLGWLWPVQRALVFVFSPVQNVLYRFGIGLNGLYTDNALPGVPVEIQQRLLALETENAQLKSMLSDQMTIGQQEEFLAQAGYKGVTAKVIGRDVRPTVNTLIVNRGSADGITVGLPVVVGGGAVIGRIISVSPATSEVLLLTDNRSGFAASLVSQERTNGKLVGDKGAGIIMDLIPQEIPMAVGDAVITSGLESFTPRGLVLGQIEEIIAEPNSLFKSARVRSLVLPHESTIVSIITPTYAQ